MAPTGLENGATLDSSGESRFGSVEKMVKNGNKWRENGFCWVLTMGIRNAPKALGSMRGSYFHTGSSTYFGH
jgi:hypothetical protein